MVQKTSLTHKGARHLWMGALNGALLLTPPLVLAFASGAARLAPWAPVYGLLLSVLVLALPVLVVKTWRTLFLLHLPLLALSPLFVWYVLNFSAPPDENAFAVLLTSSPAEVMGFVQLFRLQLPLSLSVAVLAAYAVQAVYLGHNPIPASLRKAVRWLCVPLLALLLWMPSKGPRGIGVDIGENVHSYLTSSYPLGGLISIIGGLEGNAHALGLFEKHEPYGAVANAVPATPRTHILVIGESARADRFHIFGYARQTTPELERLDGLLAFKRTYSTGNLTLLAVPMLMTGISPAAYSPQAIRGTLIDLANEAGYFTAWLSNQNIALYKIFRPRPQVWRQPADMGNWSDNHATPDDVLLTPLDDVLRDEHPHKFIVMHTYGSHWDYTLRLPDDGFHFSGRGRAAVRAAIQAETSGGTAADAYDDTILHTDFLLSQIIRRASRLPGEVTVTYIPDHGEALMATEGRVTHGFRDFNVSELHIPLLVWANPAFKAAHAAQWQALSARTEQVVSQDAVFHTTASMLGIEFPAQDPRRDLTSAAFSPVPVQQLQFRIAGSAELRRLQDAVDWPKACKPLNACD